MSFSPAFYEQIFRTFPLFKCIIALIKGLFVFRLEDIDGFCDDVSAQVQHQGHENGRFGEVSTCPAV